MAETAHVLVVDRCHECSILDDYRCDREGRTHSWDFEIECPGVKAGRCRAYFECAVKDCPLYYLGDKVERQKWLDQHWDVESVVLHGQTHVRSGEWAVPTDQCWVQVSDDTCDAVYYLDIKRPGRYEIDHDSAWDEIRLTLAEPAESRAA